MLALMFQVGPDRVAIDVRRVREVIPRVRLFPALRAPDWLVGMFVYRGRVVPVVDLHRLTQAGECPLHLSSRIILVPFPQGTDRLVGLLGTQVAEIRELPATMGLASSNGGFSLPLADGHSTLRLLDPDRLLARIDLSAVAPEMGAGP
jgi:chemotaxis-related protein WspB